MILLLLLALGIGAWLALTWYFADDEPALAPPSEARVTFKQVVQNAIQDVRDVVRPAVDWSASLVRRQWMFWGPRLTNRALIATLFADFAIVASGEDVWGWLGNHPLLAAGIVFMNLMTPLTPAGAPARIPAPPSPTGGMVNNDAIRA